MNKREMAKKLRGWGRIEINHQQLTNEVAEAGAAALEREAERVQRSMIEEARSLITARRTSEQVDAIRQTTRRLLTAVTQVVPHADAIVPEEMCK